MRKFTISLLFIGFSIGICSAQVDIEKTSQEICQCIEQGENSSPQTIKNCFEEILQEKAKLISEPAEVDSLAVGLVKQLSQTCEAVAFDSNGNHKNSSFRVVKEDRKSILSEKECRQFSSNKSYYYIESWGDTTKVQVTDLSWNESFPDGTHSNLLFRWKEGCQFETEFVKSNHFIKKDASIKGDLFQYKIVEHNAEQQIYIIYTYNGDFIVETTVHY